MFNLKEKIQNDTEIRHLIIEYVICSSRRNVLVHRLNHLQHISFFHIVYVHELVLYTLFIHIQNKVFNIKILSFHIICFLLHLGRCISINKRNKVPVDIIFLIIVKTCEISKKLLG